MSELASCPSEECSNSYTIEYANDNKWECSNCHRIITRADIDNEKEINERNRTGRTCTHLECSGTDTGAQEFWANTPNGVIEEIEEYFYFVYPCMENQELLDFKSVVDAMVAAINIELKNRNI